MVKMVSLHHYFTKGLGASLVSLGLALIVYCVMKCLTCGANRKFASAKFFVILWYALTLEIVSLFKSTEFPGSSTRVYNAYLFAWIDNCFCCGMTAVWQISLNFLMYVPLGAICADICKGKRLFYLRVPLMIAGISAANELAQYVFGLGIADIDDLLANTLGGLWGCSLYMLRRKLRSKTAPYYGALVVSCLPVVIVCAASLLYAARPYGYLKSDFNIERKRVNTVDCTAIINELPDTVTIYKASRLETEQQKSGAQNVFSALDQELDLATYDPYDTVIVYHGKIPSYYIWYWNNGFFNLSTMKLGIKLDETSRSPDEQMLGIIREMGIDIPPASEFKKTASENAGEYQLDYHFVEKEGHSYYGLISWEIRDNVLYELLYGVLKLSAVDSFPGKDHDTVCEQIKSGHFSSDDLTEKTVNELLCVSCDLQYVIDSKGFYHPVYVLDCLADGRQVKITMGAS